MMYDNSDIIKISQQSQYTVYTDKKNFILVFEHSDLDMKTKRSAYVINGLENLFKKRKKCFLENLKNIATLKNIAEIGNALPNYTEIVETDSGFYIKSRYYDADVLRTTDNDKNFFEKVFLLCRLMKNIISATGKEPVVELDNIIFENNITNQIHLLYIDLATTQNNALPDQLREKIIEKIYKRKQKFPDYYRIHNKEITFNRYHPRMMEYVNNLLDSLSPLHHNMSNWTLSCTIAKKICQFIEQDNDYLVYPYIPSALPDLAYSEKVTQALHKHGHLLFLRSDNRNVLRQVADSYIANMNRKYLYTVKGSAENGLANMLESDIFTFHSGKKSAFKCLATLKTLCSDGLLLVIENCDMENDTFFRNLLKLPSDILILTEQDYSEYGLYTLTF